jgi:hypothetical protein
VFTSAFLSRSNGGDYMGLTAGVDGIFHPFWADSRSGTFQVWTSQIRVTTPVYGNDRSERNTHIEKIQMALSEEVEIRFDPLRYNEETQEVIIPVRLQNVSQEALYGPFTVEIKNVIDPKLVPYGLLAPQIMNAANGQRGVGAVFDYSSALRDLEELERGGVTEALPWRLKIAGPEHTGFYVEVLVKGFVCRKK